MAPSNVFTHMFLILAFAATRVPGEGKLRRHNLSKELGLTHSCVKRVLATCSTSSLPQSVPIPEERSCDSPLTEGLVDALKESSSGLKALLQFLKECLDTNAVQEQSLREVKSDVQFLKEVASISATTLQTMNETVTLSMNDLKSMNVTMLESFKELEDTRKDERQILEDLVKKISYQNSVISELQKSQSNLELKISEQDNTKKIDDILNFLTVMKEAQDNDSKQQDLLQDIRKSLETALFTPRNCADLLEHGDKESGIRTVYPLSYSTCKPVSVFCDQTTDHGGWTVFQHRDDLPEREDFFRTWKEYQRGFGDIEGEFWLGLDNIHALVTGTPMELRVDLEDFDGQKKWAKYKVFSIEDAAGKYRLHLEGYSGDAGDSLMKRHSGMKFTTKDQDNDNDNKNCAEIRRGGWWYDACTDSNLNGFPHQGKYKSSNFEGIHWELFRGYSYSLRRTSMKLRPNLTK